MNNNLHFEFHAFANVIFFDQILFSLTDSRNLEKRYLK